MEVVEQLAEVSGHLYSKEPKTRQSRSVIGLPDSLVEMLAQHLSKKPDDPEALVFLIDLGLQQYDVLRHLGHSSIKTTLDLYGHKFPNRDGEL